MAQASSSGPTRTVFLLHGEDPFRIRLRANELVHSLLSDEPATKGDLGARSIVSFGGALGLVRLDARSDSPDEILVAGQSQGLFAAPDEKRVVLVEHAETIARTDVITRFPEDAALVLVAPEPMRASRARGRKKPSTKEDELALLDAVEAVGGTVERYDRLIASDVTRWITARAKLTGVTLRPDALDALSTALGGDTERVENELSKLAAWSGGQPVTGADVRSLVSGAIESDVFELTKSVVRRDIRTAAPLVEHLLAEGNAPQQLLALLLWQFRVLLFASRDPKPAEAEKMAKAIRSSPGAIMRYTQHARGLAPSDIARAYESLYACDVSIKTGRAESDEAALLLCVMDLCGVAGADYRDFLLRDAPRR
ncbi:MAG TPA: DNA polymerase III subunit delta [Candidatus Limnocylindrales bacterium]|nr:DNA polymerase III subunit delta [Candidatus Limnocylindrales bacterium]